MLTPIIDGLLFGSLYVLFGLGLTLLWSTTGIANVAHGWFVIAGSYIAYFVTAETGSLTAGLLAAVLGLAILAVPGYVAVIKPIRGKSLLNTILYTFGVGLIIEGALATAFTTDYRLIQSDVGSLSFGGDAFSGVRIAGFVAMAVILTLVWLLVHRTEFGIAMRGVSVNQDATMLMGANTDRVYFIVFILSAASAGVAGMFLGVTNSFYPHYALFPLINAFIVVVLAGVGSIPGLVIAGLGLGIVQSLTSSLLPVWTGEIISLFLLVSVLVFKPEGLFGEQEALR